MASRVCCANGCSPLRLAMKTSTTTRFCATIWCCRRLAVGIGVWPVPRRLAVWSGRRTGAGLGRRMRRWWRASSLPLRTRRRNWCWTSIVRTMRCTAARRVAFSTAIMTTTAFCRSMSSAAISCWSATLRPSNIDQAKHAWAILALLVKRLRQAWPAVRLTVRADSGFCRHKMLSWCERHEVGYIVGLAKNARINDQAARGMALAAAAYERTGEKQRVFADLSYGARSWNKERRVIARLEHGPKGANPRYVITQPRRRGEDALRAPLLRPRRDGEPHQGAAAGPLRRPHQLPQVVAPTSSV